MVQPPSPRPALIEDILRHAPPLPVFGKRKGAGIWRKEDDDEDEGQEGIAVHYSAARCRVAPPPYAGQVLTDPLIFIHVLSDG